MIDGGEFGFLFFKREKEEIVGRWSQINKKGESGDARQGNLSVRLDDSSNSVSLTA